MSHRSMVPQLLTRIALSRPRRSTSRRNSISTSLAPFAAQCEAVQARTCFWVQYIGAPLSRTGTEYQSAPRVGPLDVAELVTDDAASAALDAAFIREDHPPVIGWDVAVRRAAVDALLAHAVQADVVVDDADVRPRRIDVVSVERQLALDGGRVEDTGTGWRRGLRDSHDRDLSSDNGLL